MRNLIAAAIVATLIAAPAGAIAADLARGFFGGIDVVSTDTDRTALGVRGTERALGTAKIAHWPSEPGATDPNAAVLSLRTEGITATQGIFFDAPQGTTGKFLNIRNKGQEVFVLRPDPADPSRVVLTLRGRIETTP